LGLTAPPPIRLFPFIFQTDGDFNGDGHSDILFQNTSGQASVWKMNGNSLIGGGAVSSNPGSSWRAVA
jgi:hypothetical protein